MSGKKTSEYYKELSKKEFTEAAEKYESEHAGIYEMCKHDYPQILEEIEKEPFTDAGHQVRGTEKTSLACVGKKTKIAKSRRRSKRGAFLIFRCGRENRLW